MTFVLGAGATWFEEGRRAGDRPDRAVQVISLPNIGLFDRIANPLTANDESRSTAGNREKLFYFNILMGSQLAEQQQHDEHH